MSTESAINWEERRYELATAIFFHDIRNTDIQDYPHSRCGDWDRYVRCAAEEAVRASGIFVKEFQKSESSNKSREDG
jgi:hypothetical protein